MRKIQCRVCREWFEVNQSGFCSEDCLGRATKNVSKTIALFKEIGLKEKAEKEERLAKRLEARKRKQAKKLEKTLARMKTRQGNKFNPERQSNIERIEKKGIRVRAVQSQLKEKTKKIRALKQGKEPNGFYETREWQDLRYRVLRHYGRRCMLCGASDCELHVDHIKPRSKHPALQLSFENLQVLCRACNLGKSNKDETDWRARNA